MTTPDANPRPVRERSLARRRLANVGWVLAGVGLAAFALVNPLRIAPLDGWLHRVLSQSHHGEHEAAGAMAEVSDQLWTCGMHPQVLQDGPGQCPICGMDLTPVATGSTAGSAARPTERRVLFYRSPMDPNATSPVPRKDEMGMDYVAVYDDAAAPAASGGRPVVTIDPGIVQNMNMRTAVIERRDLKRQIRTVGYLDYDQQKMVSVTTKYPAFVEKVYVNYVGEPVRRGQALFEVYAPDLVQTQQELLSALAYAKRMEAAPEHAQARAKALIGAVRQRLSYWDIAPRQVERLEATGQVVRTLTVTAPAAGVVMRRMEGLEGMSVRPGMELFHIADLSSLWVSVEVFEDQLPWLETGSAATILLSYFPGESFTGQIRFVEPQVSEKTRTVGLRLEVPNREGRLRAGMYATVLFEPVVIANAVAVPSMAVLRSGERNLVVMDEGQGHFGPRAIELGAEGEDYVQALSGVSAGERVVTSSQFLIDSESNLREAIQKLIAARTAEKANAQ